MKNSIKSFPLFLDIGCLMGNVCQNGGVCLSNGICSCPFAYSGTTCSTCELKQILKELPDLNDSHRFSFGLCGWCLTFLSKWWSLLLEWCMPM
jgi:hypothetical protein